MSSLSELLQSLKIRLLALRKTAMQNQTANSTKIYAEAKGCFGFKLATDGALGCAEAVNEVFRRALGSPINKSSSTIDMLASLLDSAKYAEVDNGLPGDVIIAATGTGNGSLTHGHVGIVAKFGILSNDSDTGLFKEKWDLPSWENYYGRQGGFKSRFFRVL